MEDVQNSAPGSVPAGKLGARKGADPSQNAAKRYAMRPFHHNLLSFDVKHANHLATDYKQSSCS